MSANILGLGQRGNADGHQGDAGAAEAEPDKETASAAMCTLLALNTSSITLVPTTIIAMRMNYGSANPAEIVGTTLRRRDGDRGRHRGGPLVPEPVQPQARRHRRDGPIAAADRERRARRSVRASIVKG